MGSISSLALIIAGYYILRKMDQKFRSFVQQLEKPTDAPQETPPPPPLYEIDDSPWTTSTRPPIPTPAFEEGTCAFRDTRRSPLKSGIQDLHHDPLELEILEGAHPSDSMGTTGRGILPMDPTQRLNDLRRAVILKEILERKF